MRATLMTIGIGIGLTIMATQNLMEKILVANLSSGGWLLDLLFFWVPIPNAQRAVKAVKVCGYGTMVDPTCHGGEATDLGSPFLRKFEILMIFLRDIRHKA